MNGRTTVRRRGLHDEAATAEGANTRSRHAGDAGRWSEARQVLALIGREVHAVPVEVCEFSSDNVTRVDFYRHRRVRVAVVPGWRLSWADSRVALRRQAEREPERIIGAVDEHGARG